MTTVGDQRSQQASGTCSQQSATTAAAADSEAKEV
jgi:hypothetical protein